MANVEAHRCISVQFGGSGPYQNRFAAMNADTTAHRANATDVVLGVFLFEQKSSEDLASAVCFTGVNKVRVGVGGNLAAGVTVASDANGEAEAAAGQSQAVGITMEGGAVGEIISVMLKQVND